MLKSSTIKYLIVLNGLFFIAILALFLRSAMSDMEVIAKGGEAFNERITTTAHMYLYQTDMNDANSDMDETRKLTVLKDLLVATENQPINNNPKYKDYIKQAKMDLTKNKIPGNSLINNWFASYMYTGMFEDLKYSNQSVVALAPAIILTDKRWTIYSYGALITGMMLTFWLGCLFTQKKLVKIES